MGRRWEDSLIQASKQHRHHALGVNPALEGIPNLRAAHRFDLGVEGRQIIQRQIVETDHRQIFDNLAVGSDT